MDLQKFPFDQQECFLKLESCKYINVQITAYWNVKQQQQAVNCFCKKRRVKIYLLYKTYTYLYLFCFCIYYIYSLVGYSSEELQFQWRNTDPVQINSELELPQFDLMDMSTDECHKSYITGKGAKFQRNLRINITF